MSAVFSPCGKFRYRLDRECSLLGSIVFGFFGVNCSTAGAVKPDNTVTKLVEFTTRNDGRRFILGNPFAYVATDVRDLARAADPVGPENDRYIGQIIAEADVLVPCWGARTKVPRALRPAFDRLAARIFAAGKPVRTFGVTASGDPAHPLMLAYNTPLVDWRPAAT